MSDEPAPTAPIHGPALPDIPLDFSDAWYDSLNVDMRAAMRTNLRLHALYRHVMRRDYLAQRAKQR